MSTRRKPGRPPATWLPDPDLLGTLPTGTCVVLDVGRKPRVRGRLVGVAAGDVLVDTTKGERVIAMTDVQRARVVTGIFEPGDPVLRVGVPESVWRGGVVRTKGTDVLVETLADGFVWIPEVELESPELRSAAPPPPVESEVEW